jgi:hypothetical protein
MSITQWNVATMKLKNQLDHTIPKKTNHDYVQSFLFKKPIYDLTTNQSIATCQGHVNNNNNDKDDDDDDDNEWSQINHMSDDDDHDVQDDLEIDEYTTTITTSNSTNTK